MTELQFLLDLLLNHKLQKGTKQAIVERIKVVETNIIPPPRTVVMQQAPSTIAAMAAQAAPVHAPIPMAKIVGGEVNNGDGTRGKRKF